LRANAKYAAAATTELRAAVQVRVCRAVCCTHTQARTHAQPARARTGDAATDNALLAAAKASADAMAKLLAAVYGSTPTDPNAFAALASVAQASVGEAFPLVAAAKRAVPNVRDVTHKQTVQLAANEAQGAIKRLMESTKVEKGVGSEEFDDAFAILSDDAAELEQAAMAAQQRNLRNTTGQSKEESMAAMTAGARQLAQVCVCLRACVRRMCAYS
jgi:hypothetical protein